MAYFKRILLILMSLLIVGGIIFLVILNSPTLSESILRLNEYQEVALQNKLTTKIPYIWLTLVIISLLILIRVGIKTKRKWWFYLVTLPLPVIIVFIIGTVTTTLPLDHYLLVDGESLEKEFDTLQQKNTLKSEDLKIYDVSIHFRNIPLQSGTYMVARVANPTTKLQDEYWFHPLNPINKWQKDKNPVITRDNQPISSKEIDWQVVPDIIKETKQRLKVKETYYPGINMVLLTPDGDNSFEWRVSVHDIRSHSVGTMTYDLEGHLLTDEIESKRL